MGKSLPELTEAHRILATRLIRGGDCCCFAHEAQLLDDLESHGFRFIRPCGIGQVGNDDAEACALVYARLYGDPYAFVGTGPAYKRWLQGLAPKVSAWLSGVS